MILLHWFMTAAVLFASCDQEEVIPDRKPRPGSGKDVEKFNDLGIPAHKEGDPYDTYEGLVMAEIELESQDEAFERPSWLGEEVTGDPRFYNGYLARNPFKNW